MTVPPTVPQTVPRPLTRAALDHLERSEVELLAARAAADPARRLVHAHLAALRAASALVAVRGRPPGPRRTVLRNVWDMLPRLEDDLTGPARTFAASAAQRSALEAGRAVAVDAPTADELLLAAHDLHDRVESLLGLDHLHPLAG